MNDFILNNPEENSNEESCMSQDCKRILYLCTAMAIFIITIAQTGEENTFMERIDMSRVNGYKSNDHANAMLGTFSSNNQLQTLENDEKTHLIYFSFAVLAYASILLGKSLYERNCFRPR